MRLWWAVVLVFFQAVKWEKLYLFEFAAKITFQPSLIPIGSLDEFLIPIGPLSQLQNEFLA
jgi:hypothetical protein